MSEVFGVILAGGQARRMGGVDKGLIEIGGETLIARLLRRLAPQCAGLALNANGDPARFRNFGLDVIADDLPDFAGPLAGVLAGMDYVAARDPAVARLVTVPADTPFVPRDLIERLAAAREKAGARIAIARSGGRDHPTVSLWDIGLRGELRRALVEQDERKVTAFVLRYDFVAVEWPTEPFDPFFNVNQPQDLTQACAIAEMDR